MNCDSKLSAGAAVPLLWSGSATVQQCRRVNLIKVSVFILTGLFNPPLGQPEILQVVSEPGYLIYTSPHEVWSPKEELVA